LILLAGSGVSDGDFHFADWIDRHEFPSCSV
jgi:hypothetical protein